MDQLQSLLAQLPPAAALAAVAARPIGDDKSNPIESGHTAADAQLISAAREYSEVWAECARAGLVAALIPDIDLMRFISDKSYQHESVLELTHRAPFAPAAPASTAKVADSKAVDTKSADVDSSAVAVTMDGAILLCTRYSIPVFDVYAERLKWLFGAAPSVQIIRDELKSGGAMHSSLSSAPDRFELALCEAYRVTDGLDLQRMAYLFTLADECWTAKQSQSAQSGGVTASAVPPRALSVTATSVAAQHLAMLQNFVKAGIAVDYKQLIDPVTCASHLQHVVLEEVISPRAAFVVPHLID